MAQTGRCLCGAVTYEVTGPLRGVINCHCYRCRRHTGHFMVATQTDVTDIAIQDESLSWYKAAETVQYGFCSVCGSTMFWRALDLPEEISIAAGTLDPPTGLKTESAWYTAEASDYHTLDRQIINHSREP